MPARAAVVIEAAPQAVSGTFPLNRKEYPMKTSSRMFILWVIGILMATHSPSGGNEVLVGRVDKADGPSEGRRRRDLGAANRYGCRRHHYDGRSRAHSYLSNQQQCHRCSALGNCRSYISGGSGKFAGATGYLDYFGIADFSQNTLVLGYRGQVC